MSLKHGALFTNKKLNNELYFMTGNNIISDKKCMSSFKIYKINDLNKIYLNDNTLLSSDDLDYLDFVSDETFTKFKATEIFIDTKNLEKVAYATSQFGGNKQNKKEFYLMYLETNPEYRDCGFAKSLMEVIKTYASFIGKDYITGQMIPLDKLKNKNPVKPAKNIKKQVYHYESIFSIYDEVEDLIFNSCEDELDDENTESANTLKEIYNHLGFDVNMFPQSNTGTLHFDLKNFTPTKNMYTIVNLLCNETICETDNLAKLAILDEFVSTNLDPEME